MNYGDMKIKKHKVKSKAISLSVYYTFKKCKTQRCIDNLLQYMYVY